MSSDIETVEAEVPLDADSSTAAPSSATTDKMLSTAKKMAKRSEFKTMASSISHDIEGVPEDPMVIIAAGLPRSGKSRAMSVIFKIPFKDACSGKSVTTEVASKYATLYDNTLKVIDIPGLGALDILTAATTKQLKKEIGKSEFILLYCISVAPDHSLNIADAHVMETIQKTLGREVWKKCVILLTFSDLLRKEANKNYNEVLREHVKEINKLLQKVQPWIPFLKANIEVKLIDDIDIHQEKIDCIAAIPVYKILKEDKKEAFKDERKESLKDERGDIPKEKRGESPEEERGESPEGEGGENPEERGESQEERGESQEERGESQEERGESQEERGESQEERGESQEEERGKSPEEERGESPEEERGESPEEERGESPEEERRERSLKEESGENYKGEGKRGKKASSQTDREANWRLQAEIEILRLMGSLERRRMLQFLHRQDRTRNFHTVMEYSTTGTVNAAAGAAAGAAIGGTVGGVIGIAAGGIGSIPGIAIGAAVGGAIGGGAFLSMSEIILKIYNIKKSGKCHSTSEQSPKTANEVEDDTESLISQAKEDQKENDQPTVQATSDTTTATSG